MTCRRQPRPAVPEPLRPSSPCPQSEQGQQPGLDERGGRQDDVFVRQFIRENICDLSAL